MSLIAMTPEPARINLMQASPLSTNLLHGLMKAGVRTAVPLLLCCLLVSELHAVVYLKPKEALKQLFVGSEVVKADKKALSAADCTELSKRLGYDITAREITFFVGRSGERIDGYALMDEQVGKTQPITFMTKIGRDGTVEEIEVLAYRESHGSQIRFSRFREQFRGKDKEDPLRLGHDIQNITGATLSVRATTEVVRRALILWDYFYGSAKNP